MRDSIVHLQHMQFDELEGEMSSECRWRSGLRCAKACFLMGLNQSPVGWILIWRLFVAKKTTINALYLPVSGSLASSFSNVLLEWLDVQVYSLFAWVIRSKKLKRVDELSGKTTGKLLLCEADENKSRAVRIKMQLLGHLQGIGQTILSQRNENKTFVLLFS